jgi:uncharacterized protein (DUF2252 family)
MSTLAVKAKASALAEGSNYWVKSARSMQLIRAADARLHQGYQSVAMTLNAPRQLELEDCRTHCRR